LIRPDGLIAFKAGRKLNYLQMDTWTQSRHWKSFTSSRSTLN